MEVTFQYTEDDLQVLAKRYPWHKRWAALLWVMLLILLGMGLASVLPAVFGFWQALAICWGLFGVFLAAILILVAVRRPRIDLSQVRPITMRLEDAYWRIRSDVVRMRNDWSTFLRVEDSNDRIFIFVEPLKAFVIPKSAFPLPAEATAFAEFARRKSTGASRSTDSNTPRWPLSEPDLIGVSDTPHIVRGEYTPTMNELMTFEMQGVNPKKAKTNMAAWMCAVAIVALVVLFLRQADTAALFLACLVVGFYCIAFCVVVYGWIQRRQWRKNFNSRRLETTTLAAGPRGISLCSASLEGHVNWAAYTGLRKTEELFVLDGRKPNFENLVIPRRAFHSAEDAARFEALVREHLKQHVFGDAPELPQPAETGNPYQPPLQDA